MKSNEDKFLKKINRYIAVAFIIINILMAIYAYSFTHVVENSKPISKELNYSLWDKIKMVFTGVTLPRPQSETIPARTYNTIKIPADQNRYLEAWTIKTDSVSKGMVILYHGYMDEKSKLLRYAYPILDMGYDVMLIDFRGSGNSYGNQTTIGYFEAENVKQSVDYAMNTLKEDRIFLLGFSMGAAAIIKAQHDYKMPAVKGLIAEAAYGTLSGTIEARAHLMGLGILSKPGGYIFTFWLGTVNLFDAFRVNPEEYAITINKPIMIACGAKDQYIPKSETRRIYDNLASKNKTLVFYPDCTHELYIEKYPHEWRKNISSFLNNIP